MAINTSANTSAVIMSWFEKKTLSRLVQETHLYNLSWKRTLETGRGKTVTWVRFGVQNGNTTPIVEGNLVAPTTVSASNVTASLQQYGEVFAASDLLNDTSVTPMEEALQDQATQALAYTVDAVIRAEVDSSCQTFNTNLFAANGAASIAAITSGDTLKAADLRKSVARLAKQSVPKFDSSKYVAVISASQGYDVRSETAAGSFLTLAQQSDSGIKMISEDAKTINKTKGLIGELFGLAIYESALQPVVNNGTVDVHYAYFFGDESLASVNLSSQNMQLFRKKPAAGTYDPLEQIGMAVGYKAFFASKNLSETGKARILVMGSAVSI
jgi:N4-gp56 family major capsid protein